MSPVGDMGTNMSPEEKHVFELMSELLEKPRKSVAAHSPKLILHWAASHIKGLKASTAFPVELWDEWGNERL